MELWLWRILELWLVETLKGVCSNVTSHIFEQELCDKTWNSCIHVGGYMTVFADKHIVEIAGIVVCLQGTFSVSLLLWGVAQVSKV